MEHYLPVVSPAVVPSPDDSLPAADVPVQLLYNSFLFLEAHIPAYLSEIYVLHSMQLKHIQGLKTKQISYKQCSLLYSSFEEYIIIVRKQDILS